MVSSGGLCGVLLPGSLLITSPPSPSRGHGSLAVLVVVVEQMLVGDGLRPNYSQDSSKVLGV